MFPLSLRERVRVRAGAREAPACAVVQGRGVSLSPALTPALSRWEREDGFARNDLL
jgi:hypothetical protein